MSKQTEFEVQQCYCTDGVDWQEFIRVHIDQALKRRVQQCRVMMKNNPEIRDISLNVPQNFYNEEDCDALMEQLKFDVEKISVHKTTVYLCIQGKYDCSAQAEYDLSKHFPLPKRNY